MSKTSPKKDAEKAFEANAPVERAPVCRGDYPTTNADALFMTPESARTHGWGGRMGSQSADVKTKPVTPAATPKKPAND